MTISPITSNNSENNTLRPFSQGEMAYACARNQHQAHNLLVRVIKESSRSQKELAQMASIDEATLSRLVRRPKNVEIDTLSKLIYCATGATLTMTLAYPRTHSKLDTAEYRKTGIRVFLLSLPQANDVGDPKPANSNIRIKEAEYA